MRPFLAFTVRQAALATVSPAMPRPSLSRQSELAASILSEDGQAKACIVTNISPKGAQLSLSTTEDLPPSSRCEFQARSIAAGWSGRSVVRPGSSSSAADPCGSSLPGVG